MVTRPVIYICCKTFAHGQENVVDNEQPGNHVVSVTAAMITAGDFLMSSD